jgi:hypothetical protein
MQEDIDPNKKQLLKYAIEELHRWLRHIETSTWQIFTVLLAGTIYGLIRVVEAKIENNLLEIGYCIIIILLWLLFLFFTKDIVLKYQYYLDEINDFEKELKQNIFPDKAKELPTKIDPKVFTKLLARVLNPCYKMLYFTAMVIISFIVIIIAILVIVGIILSNYFLTIEI